MSKLSTVWVFSDAASRLPELVAGGARYGEVVSVFVIGSADDVKSAFTAGASTVYHLGDKDPARIIEDYADTMAKTIAEGGKPSLVLLPANRRGKALASKLGAKLQAGVVTEASELVVEADGILARHMVYGGLAIGEDRVMSPVAVATVGSGVFEAAPADASRTGETVSVAFVQPKHPIRCVERRAKQVSSVDLAKAKRVVGVGRGISQKEDIAIAEALCGAIGAELGCSRPIAESEKWMEHERYIGVSGNMISPDFYVAVGISGQIQHMVGANGAHTIFAINKDKNAPIFESADYGIVGDLYTIVPALVSALKG